MAVTGKDIRVPLASVCKGVLEMIVLYTGPLEHRPLTSYVSAYSIVVHNS